MVKKVKGMSGKVPDMMKTVPGKMGAPVKGKMGKRVPGMSRKVNFN